MAFGFVDDTMVVVQGQSTQQNFRALKRAYDKCFAWVKRYRAIFAPKKYQLIYFTRKSLKSGGLREGVNIEGIYISSNTEIRILGVLIDMRLKWGPKKEEPTRKGEAASHALSKITSLAWGPYLRKCRL